MVCDFQKLMAESYDKANTLGENELNYWISRCQDANGPILELGSGTGRLLIPLLKKGFDVSGLDSSNYMIDICNKKNRCSRAS